MATGEVTIVGAGLSGLTAAINLAREGMDVLVLDKENRHGGRPEFRPDGAASPFDLAALEAYTGIDISPACKRMEKMVWCAFGRQVDILYGEGSQTYLVERGPRSTSLDTLLYETARDAGVKFEWGQSIKSPSDVAWLPDGSIIANRVGRRGLRGHRHTLRPVLGMVRQRHRG
jgi:flavin-dependent dehydrogenase